MSVLDKTEKRDGLAVYWCVDETTGKREYGICFENGLFNIANQSIAESLLLALDMASDDIDSLVTGVPRSRRWSVMCWLWRSGYSPSKSN